MAQSVAIGIADYDELIHKKCFYVDKTEFIKSWWESDDKVTLITRPRRFGKTLTMSMVKCFFSVNYGNRADLFQNQKIWQYEEYRKLQGSYPVIFLSFASADRGNYKSSTFFIKNQIVRLYGLHSDLLSNPLLSRSAKSNFAAINRRMDEDTAIISISQLCEFFYTVYHKKTIILVDEYDTPMIDAWSYGYWNDMSKFMQSFFKEIFKNNPYLERGLMTGITRVAKESIFSGLNNLKAVSSTSPNYADIFGFTEEEVFAAMDERRKSEEDKQEVKRYYDGFTFGDKKEIYNPWSIINYLDDGRLLSYWTNTSTNDMIKKVIQEGSEALRFDIISLLNGEQIQTELNEYIVFSDLDEDAVIWSLLAAAGYLRIEYKEGDLYTLSITNFETKGIFKEAIRKLVKNGREVYGRFSNALFSGNISEINEAIQKFAEASFSYYDMKKKEPECFYHGFVLGLTAELFQEYMILSNRESGKGRADVLIYPRNFKGNAFILEFKAIDKNAGEKKLEDTVQAALKQIEVKEYVSKLYNLGFNDARIRKYGFAFSGKKGLAGSSSISTIV